MITIIHCDKCNSSEVLHEIIVPPPEYEHLTMSEIVTRSKTVAWTHDVYYYTQYRMVCKDCGHIVRYQK